jgi:hypothetical protein
MPLFDDPPLHDFPDRAIRYLLETPANLRELLLEVVPDIAPFLDYSRLVELRRREEIRGHDLLWFVLSWALRRRPPEDREELRTFLQTTIADEALQEEVLAVSNTLGQTWEEWVEQRVAASASRAELQTRREALRDLLEEHFGAVPEDVLRRIEACEDAARLKAALRQVLHVQSPADLQL